MHNFEPDTYLEWDTEEGVINFLQRKSECRRMDLEKRAINKKRYKLKLVIRKDYET